MEKRKLPENTGNLVEIPQKKRPVFLLVLYFYLIPKAMRA